MQENMLYRDDREGQVSVKPQPRKALIKKEERQSWKQLDQQLVIQWKVSVGLII